MAALEGKKITSMFLKIDGFYRYIEHIDILKIDVSIN
jgi:hypothetical protein